MAGAPSSVGSTFSVSASTPATVDSSGFSALTWTALNGVVQFDGAGDTHAAIAVPLVSGRVDYANDIADGGTKTFTLQYVASDAGQGILLSNNGGTTTVSVKRVDANPSRTTYFYGIVNSVVDMPAQSGQYRGYTGQFYVQSATVRV